METVTENYQKLSKYTANSVVSKLSKFTDNLRKTYRKCFRQICRSVEKYTSVMLFTIHILNMNSRSW